jgi:ubiquinone biosynthesis protein UbiJ
MTDAEIMELADQAGIMPWIKHEWDGKKFVHTDEGMDGDAACLIQFAKLISERERERAAMICHQCRDWEYAAEEIAFRIMNQA